MRELRGTAVNFGLAVQPTEPPTIMPMAELVVLVTEPRYRVVGKAVGRERHATAIRFAAGVEALRGLAASATEYADTLEALARQTAIAPADGSES